MPTIFLQGIPDQEFYDRTAAAVFEMIKAHLPKMDNSPEFLTRKQAAGLLHISLPTLSLYCKNSTIPSYRVGSNIRFKKSEIEQIVNSGLRFKYTGNKGFRK
jgi:excisionase family DNA binding protein